jgi:hypothetical protein
VIVAINETILMLWRTLSTIQQPDTSEGHTPWMKFFLCHRERAAPSLLLYARDQAVGLGTPARFLSPRRVIHMIAAGTVEIHK